MNGKRVNRKWSFVVISLMISAGLFWLLSTALQSPPAARVMAAPDAPLAPSPTSFIPEPNSHYAPRNAPVTVNFDEAIDAATVTSYTFAVFGSQSSRVTGTYSLSNLLRTVTLHPAREYFPGELIHATVTTGTQNITGEQALSAAVWQFRAAVGLGNGLFAEVDSQLSPTYGSDVALGDMDNDGDLDALLVDSINDSAILHNDGGIFQLSHILPTAASSSSAGGLGDVDGDGDLDAFVATSNGVELWENFGSGTFTNPQYLGTAFGYDVALGDVDADGDLDALVVEGMDTRVWVNQGQASGTFSDTLPALTQASEPMEAVALGDVDNDGDLDAYQVRYSGSGDEVWLNDGTGLFSLSLQSLDQWDSQDVALGDLDGDGDLDAFVVNALNQGNTVWFNTGTASGIFTDSGQSLGFADSYAVSLGDVDGDGDLDALVANAGVTDSSDVVYINDVAGYFTARAFGDELEGYGAALGDVDRDGDLDAVIANDDAPLGFWRNDPPVCFAQLASDGSVTYASLNADAIQQAVDAALTDDVVKIAGTCAGVTQYGGTWQTVYVDKPLTLRGGYTPDAWNTPDPAVYAFLDAQNAGRVALITGPVSVTLEQLDIGYGDATGQGGGPWSYDGVGGGIYVVSATVTLRNNRIHDNVAGRDGWGGRRRRLFLR